MGTRVLLKKCKFTERHKLSDHFDTEQHVVVKCNADGDLYAVRPICGGTEKWLNRKMLIEDPRDELPMPREPFPNLPGFDDSSDHESESDSESFDVVVLTAPPQVLKPPVVTKEVDRGRNRCKTLRATIEKESSGSVAKRNYLI